jgi:hypothetical protein
VLEARFLCLPLTSSEFDIGNHFCECCGFECDWSQFPTRAQQVRPVIVNKWWCVMILPKLDLCYLRVCIAGYLAASISGTSPKDCTGCRRRGGNRRLVPKCSAMGGTVSSVLMRICLSRQFSKRACVSWMASSLQLVPNLFWGIWAIFQARNAKIDFDYLTYAKVCPMV